MTVLVTGGAGYIGSHMVLALYDAGEKVVVLDDLSTGFWWALPADVALVKGDMGDADLVSRTIAEHGVTEIVHFAAKIVVPDSVADPLGYYLNNTVKTRQVIECAVKGGVKHFVFSSTAAVYGETSTEPVAESTVLDPVSPYGKSKLMSEWMLRDVTAAHGMKHVILRYFNVAGADPKGRTGQSTPNATHLIKVACQAALGKRNGMDVYGTDYPTRDGSCLRDYIQVSDLAQAHRDALTYLRNGGESQIFNCGYGRGYSVLEVVDVVKKVSGVNFEARIQGRRPGDPAAIIAKSDKIRATLGWTPQYDDLEKIVAQALAWEDSLKRRNLNV
jgi:UDP-glucose 4-epimerase